MNTFTTRRAPLALALLLLASAACSDDSGTRPEVNSLTAAIQAPEFFILSCEPAVSVMYQAKTTGTVDRFHWTDESGAAIGDDPDAEVNTVRYTSRGSKVVNLTVEGPDGATASDRHTLTVENPRTCAGLRALIGERQATWLIPPEQAGVEVTFPSESTPNPGGTIVSTTWTLDGDTVDDGDTFELVVREEGLHQVGLVVENNLGATAADSMRIAVFQNRACGPSTKPETLNQYLFLSVPDDPDAPAEVRIRDLQTGEVSDVILERDDRFRGAIDPCANQFAVGFQGDLIMANLDGSGLRAIDSGDGFQWAPTINRFGWIAYLDDGPSGGAMGSVALARLDGTEKFFLAGDDPSVVAGAVEFAGQGPSFSPDGTVLAVGNVRVPENDRGRIMIYKNFWIGRDQIVRRQLHDDDALVRAYGTREVGEGPGGVAWAPEPDFLGRTWIAVTIADFDDNAQRKVYLVNPAGNGESIFAGPGSFPTWTHDGSKVLYQSSGGHVMSFELRTGEIVDETLRHAGADAVELSPIMHR